MAKIKEEQLEQIKSLRETQSKVRLELGDLHLTKKSIEARQNSLEQESMKAEESAQQLLNDIREEHGDGSVDIESGEFTPAE